MKAYIRKIFPHDLKKEINVTKDIAYSFFKSNEFETFTVEGKIKHHKEKVTINTATDPRFSNNIKNIIKSELGGEFSVNDFLLFQTIKNKKNSFLLEVIVPKDERYSFFQNLLSLPENKKELRHYVIEEDNDKILELNNELQDKEYLPHNRIFFGAPGTGKSYKLKTEAEQFGSNSERVTFHPNYSYGNFIGSFKPYASEDGITYKYVPGPFMRILVEALKNKDEKYLLIIEEINRANVSAVFGDFFQLLDRDDEGKSEYVITTSEELRTYLNKEIPKEEYPDIDTDTLYIPKNLYIWATMNSADQGVMPMDTAFKRRWDFTYIGVDESEDTLDEEKSKFYINENEDLISWNDFRKEVNKHLSDCNVPEDKLMGPYFISRNILHSENPKLITETIINKVLMYLYEDVKQACHKKLFDKEKSETFSSLCKNFKVNGLNIFNPPLQLSFLKNENEEDKGDKTE